MTGDQISKFRGMIKSEIRMLLEKMNELQFPDPVRERIADESDQASAILEKDIELLLKDRDRIRLKLLYNALRRMEAGTYGICDECKKQIPEKRLELNPVTANCITCQDRAERNMGFTRKRNSNGYLSEHKAG